MTFKNTSKRHNIIINCRLERIAASTIFPSMVVMYSSDWSWGGENRFYCIGVFCCVVGEEEEEEEGDGGGEELWVQLCLG